MPEPNYVGGQLLGDEGAYSDETDFGKIPKKTQNKIDRELTAEIQISVRESIPSGERPADYEHNIQNVRTPGVWNTVMRELLESILGRISALEQRRDDFDTDITDLQNRVASLESRVAALESAGD